MSLVKRAKVGAILPNNVNTDLIFPARYLMLFAPNEVRKHLFEDVDPTLAVKLDGAAILGGENFGCGSAREQGLTALKYGGVEMLICKSYSRAFFRNGYNNAVPLFIADCPETIVEIASTGDELEANFETGLLSNLTTGKAFQCSPTPSFLIDLLKEDGIWNYCRHHKIAWGKKS